jgi:hypothetical protein
MEYKCPKDLLHRKNDLFSMTGLETETRSEAEGHLHR